MPRPPPLQKPRLRIHFFDPSNPSHYEYILGLYNAPFLTELWGDTGLKTPGDLDARSEKIRLPKAICKKAPDTVPSHQWHLCYLNANNDGDGDGDDANDEDFLGFVGVHRHNPSSTRREVGYCFKPEHQEKGYCTEAAVEVPRHYKEVVGLEWIVATVSSSNVASCKVAEKAGGLIGGGEGGEDVAEE